MRRLLCALCLFVAGVASADIFITKTEFSMDEGKTWTVDPPILKTSSPKFQVRVSYTGSDYRALSNNGYISNSLKADHDFKSSFGQCAAPLDEQPPKAWHYLRLPPRPFVYLVDLGERPANSGMIDRVSKKPCPPCAAWKPGVYRFVINLNYWLDEKVFKDMSDRRVMTDETFMITLED